MNDEIQIEGKRYVSVRRFSKNSSYTSDHLSRLCRLNRLDCKLFGRVWFVNPGSFDRYQKNFSIRKNGNGNSKEIQNVTNYRKKENQQNNKELEQRVTLNKGKVVNNVVKPSLPINNNPISDENSKPKIQNKGSLGQAAGHSFEPIFRLRSDEVKIPIFTSLLASRNKKDSWDNFFHEHASAASAVIPNQIEKKTGLLPKDFSVLTSNRLSRPRPKVITPSSYHAPIYNTIAPKPTQTLGKIFPPKKPFQEKFSRFSFATHSDWKKVLSVGTIITSSAGIIILLFFIGNSFISPKNDSQIISQEEISTQTEVIYTKSDKSLFSYIQDGFFAARGRLSSLLFSKKAPVEKVTVTENTPSDLQTARERLLSQPEPETIFPTSTSTGFIPETVDITEILETEIDTLKEQGLIAQTPSVQPLTKNDVEKIINNILSTRFVVGDAVAEEARVTGIVNRIITRSNFTVDNAASLSDLNTLENKLRQEIFKVGDSNIREVRVVERQVSLTNKIDQLPDVTLINATVSGTFNGLTDAHIPDDITASNSLPLTGGTLTGTLTGTDATFTGTLTVSSSAGTTTLASNVLTTFIPTTVHSFGTWAIGVAGANPLGASVVINPASADSDTNLLAIAVGGEAKFLVDAEGDVFANSITAVGGVTLSTTTSSDFSVENTATFGDSTTTDRTYFNSRIGSSLIPTANNSVDIGDTSNGLAWRTGIFGTSLGVGTTTPTSVLTIEGNGYISDTLTISNITATGTLSISGLSSLFGGFISSASSSATSLSATDLFASSTIVADGQALFALTGGSVGIGTTSPSKRLSVADEVSDAQVAIAYDTTRYAHLQVDSAGDLIIDAQGGDIRLNDENLFVCASGSCPSGTPSAQGSVIAETEIGIGSSTPAAQLGVANNIFIGGGGAPALGTATSTFEGDIIILGKLDVGTIDPAYTIGNTTYATYGHSTVGVKEEVVVNLVPTHFNTSVGSFEHIIDFDTLPETSDLWLFYQITDFGESWKNLVVSATAGFDGFVFYKKVPTENKLIIASTERGEIALRLIAPRFDSDKWGNVRPDQDGWKGFILNLKEKLN